MSLMIVVEGDTDVKGYNQAARGSPWFVLRDLDQDASCAPELLRSLCPIVSPWMVLRIAVREVESWLLADAKAMAEFLGVPERLLPSDPDAEADPRGRGLP